MNAERHGFALENDHTSEIQIDSIRVHRCPSVVLLYKQKRGGFPKETGPFSKTLTHATWNAAACSGVSSITCHGRP